MRRKLAGSGGGRMKRQEMAVRHVLVIEGRFLLAVASCRRRFEKPAGDRG
jgi:hypothetical protein